MNEIYKWNLNENTIKGMIELNPDIEFLSDEDVISKVKLLEKLNCNEKEIKNIISSNSGFLLKSDEEILELVNKMKEYGFKNINLLIEANPFILGMYDIDLESYIETRKENGENITDIVDDLESHPYLFNEI